MFQEKRVFARLAMHAEVTIRKRDRVIEGEVEDLSMKGMFITGANPVEKDETVAVTICDTPIYGLKAKVVRVTDAGIGLEFEKTLFD
ncbi:MAG TPA: PilZ domain-containing protein [Geomonas sp.]|nr:PilZ domain-containing protein [Geomonas sp.]